MGGKPSCNAKDSLCKCPWTEHVDLSMIQFVQAWPAPAKTAVLRRCGKSYRLCWVTYFWPKLNHVNISLAEEDFILRFHTLLESSGRWSLFEGHYMNTRLSKKPHANEWIGRLKSVRPTERNTAVSMTSPLNPNRFGERDEGIQPVGWKRRSHCLLYWEALAKGSTSSNTINKGKTLISPVKQNPSSCSDAGTVSAHMKLWNPLQLPFNQSSSWANSYSLQDDCNVIFVHKPVGYNQEMSIHVLVCWTL